MLIIIVPLLIFAIALTLIFINYKFWDFGFLEILCWLLILLSVVAIATLPLIADSVSQNAVENYNNRKEQYQQFVENLNIMQSSGGLDVDLIKKIQDYNKAVGDAKKYSNNIWIGKFYNPYYNALDIIELPYPFMEV